jgi:hypothetical protein
MRLRLALLLASLLAVLILGGWFIKHRRDVNKREHAAALTRASREPGVLIPDPALSPGVIEVDLIPAGPSIELSTPAMIRVGQRTEEWSSGRPARFEEMAGKRDLRVSAVGEYLVEGALLDGPHGGSGARIALRAIPTDPPFIGSWTEKYLEVSSVDPKDIILWWKQSNVVIAETRVPRAAPREALAAEIQKEWVTHGWHRDPSDRRFDLAIIRFEPGTLFYEIFPLVDAILVPKRTINKDGESRSVPAFHVSLQPAPASPRRNPDLDMGRPRSPSF